MKGEKVILIDGHAMAFRAYFAMSQQGLTNSSGMPVGTTLAFYRMLAKLLKDLSPEYILLLFDPKGKNFRHDMYSEYKANRPEAPEEFKIQINEIQEIARKIEFPMFIPKNAEADDAIASFIEQNQGSDLKFLIISADKDFYPLLDLHVSMLRPKKGISNFTEIHPAYVQEETKVSVGQFEDYLAIIGDSSDNIPGVKGLGPKGASRLILEYGSLEAIYDNIERIEPASTQKKLKDSQENAFLSKKLIHLQRDIDIPIPIEKMKLDILLEKKDLWKCFRDKELNVVYQEWLNLAGNRASENIPSARIGENYKIIRSKKDWERILPTLKKLTEIAVDTETTHTSPMKAVLLGISFSWAALPGEEKESTYDSAYIPCFFSKAINPNGPVNKDISDRLFIETDQIHSDYKGLPEGEEVLKWLAEILENEKIRKIGQNIKYDWLVLRRHGIHLKNVDTDTMLLSFLLKPNQRRHNLDDMALDHLGHQNITFKELVGTGRNRIPLTAVPLERLTEYACEDAEVTLRLKDILYSLVEKAGLVSLYTKIDLPLVYTMMRMEESGVVLDIPYLRKLEADYQKSLSEIEQNIYRAAGEEFNIQSTIELRKILFEKLGIQSTKKTDKGQLSTDHKVLESLKDRHPVVKHLLNFRLLSKMLSTYVIPLPEAVNKNTGRVHTSFSQVTAATGRLASTEPNLQNIPIRVDEGRAIRKAFIASKNCELLSLDYSQIELRILAHYSEDKNLTEAYSKDQDIHDQAAYLLFNHCFEEETSAWNLDQNREDSYSQNNTKETSLSDFDEKRLEKMKHTKEFSELRAKAKVLNFSIIYGVTDWGLSRSLGISKQEGADLIRTYLASYPGIKRYMERIILETKERGYAENLFGRRRNITDLDHSQRFKREASERLAMNTPIQSTAADIIKLAMNQIQEELEHSESRLLLQIHDELLLEVPNNEKQHVYEMVRSKMEGVVSLKVPLKVSGGFGRNWDEAKGATQA